MRVCVFTVSNALDMSSATAIVRVGGFLLLNPCVMLLFSVCSAVEVECLALNPCWYEMFGMLDVMYGSMIFSRSLEMGDMREMGLYEVPMFGSLLGLRMGMMFANFHMCGMVFVFSARVNVCVRYRSASGPRCFRCRMLILSGPVELLFLLF